MTAVFLLTLLQRVFSGPLGERWAGMPDLTLAERCVLAPVIVLMFVVGLYPQLISGMLQGTVIAVCRPGEVLTMLAWTIYLSFLGAVAVTLTPAKSPAVTRAHRLTNRAGRAWELQS